MERDVFEQLYAGQAPWTPGGPNPPSSNWPKWARFVAASSTLAAARARMSCTWRREVTSARGSISCRLQSSRQRPRPCTGESTPIFLVGNALELHKLGRQFRHGARLRPLPYVHRRGTPPVRQGTRRILGSGGTLYLLCFSDDEPGTEGPRRVTQQEIRDAFQDGWQVKQIEPTRIRVGRKRAG